MLGAIISEVMAIITYAVVVSGVYKLFQIATELQEIKKLLKDGAQAGQAVPAASPYAEIHPTDDATDYAAKLLRAVNAESRPVTPSVWPSHRSPQ
jgi:hypothetical protein